VLNNDLRDAFRAIRRKPVYALVSVGTLTLGVGAVLAIFSLANVLLIRPLPGISDPDRLVRVMRVDRVGTGASPMSYPLYEAVREGVPAFSGVATQQSLRVDIATGDGSTPRRTALELVSGNYFDVLGAVVQSGRPIAQRDIDEAAPVVVVSRSRCDAVRSGGACLGETLTMNGDGPYEIVGVAAAVFGGTWLPGRSDAWAPISRMPFIIGGEAGLLKNRGISFLGDFIGRLRPGATMADAQAQLDAVAATVASRSPIYARQAASERLTPYPGLGLRPTVRVSAMAILRQLGGVAAALLLLTCLNVGVLWRARAMDQQREFAVRRALGATRMALIRRQLVEYMVLALAGCAGALGICALLAKPLGTIRLLPFLAPLGTVTPDTRVFVLAVLISIVCGLAAGVGPAALVSHRNAVSDLRSTTVTRSLRGPFVLVAGQIAVAFALLVAAGVLVASVRNLLSVELGYESNAVVSVSVNPPTRSYTAARRGVFFRQLLDRLSSDPAFDAAALAYVSPFAGFSSGVSVAAAAGSNVASIPAKQNLVTGAYFTNMGIRMLGGRGFTDAEVLAATSPEVAVISRHLARQLFGTESSALGRPIVRQGRPLQIVGVVADVRMANLREAAEPMIYEPIGQFLVPSWVYVQVRATMPLSAVQRSIERHVAALDPSVPVRDGLRMDTAVRDSLTEERVLAALSLTLAVIALLLATIGLFGVITQGVAARLREFGVRIALGAPPGRLMALVFRQAVTVGVLGIAAGWFGAAALTRLVASRLFGIHSYDPWMLGAVSMVLLAVVVLTAVAPAWRAARVDPLVVLRAE
jgi:putative ABC transport system permease protein